MPKGYIQSPLLIVRYAKARGKGGRAVYARKNISRGTLVEWAPCIMIPEDEVGFDFGQVLPWYVFEWGKQDGKVMNGLALGYISLYNHSYDPNAYYEMEEPDCITIWAMEDIAKGTEITINYNGDPTDKTPVGFKVNGRGGVKSGGKARRMGALSIRKSKGYNDSGN